MMMVERVWPRFSHHRGFITRTTTVASLSAARLSYPGGAPTQPLCLDIQRPASGGHALLGSNGHGKTLLAQALLDDSLLLSGELKRPGRGARVSFESHQELLAKGGTVYKALGYGGTLSAAAKYLAVRFGLHPLLYRPVRSISTGEIRKVLLARALAPRQAGKADPPHVAVVRGAGGARSAPVRPVGRPCAVAAFVWSRLPPRPCLPPTQATRPSLLVLDNAFDGLDAPSREVLKQLIGHTLRGFGQLLVQGIDASATAHTQAPHTPPATARHHTPCPPATAHPARRRRTRRTPAARAGASAGSM